MQSSTFSVARDNMASWKPRLADVFHFHVIGRQGFGCGGGGDDIVMGGDDGVGVGGWGEGCGGDCGDDRVIGCGEDRGMEGGGG